MICQLWVKPNIEIPHDENHIFFSWDGCVFFSARRMGDTLDCHVAAKFSDRKKLKIAINMFCQYAFFTYPWCKKISACVKMKSVKNLIVKCGFKSYGNVDDYEVFLRWE